MRRILIIVAALSGCCCATSGAAEIEAVLLQARRAFVIGYVVAEQEGKSWWITRLRGSHGGRVLTDADLSGLAELTRLVSLNLRTRDVRVTDKGWENLTPLAELRDLALFNITALRPLRGLASLESLDLDYDPRPSEQILDQALDDLKALPRLRRLSLAGVVGLTDTSLPYITALKGLEELNWACSFDISGAGLAQLRALTKLRSLNIYKMDYSEKSGLKDMLGLENLTIERCTSRTGVLDFTEWESLKSLKFGQECRREKGTVRLPTALRQLRVPAWTAEDYKAGGFHVGEPFPKNVESVNVILRVHPDEKGPWEVDWLRSLPELRELTLENPDPDEITAITGLARLRSLTLAAHCTGKPSNDECIKHVSGMGALESLSIGVGGVFTDAGMGALGALKGLKRLELRYVARATAAGLFNIWKLTGLEILHVNLPQETADGSVRKALEGIKSLANLQELTLSGDVTNDALKSLAQLRKLRRLDLSDVRGYTDEGLAELVKALPELKTVSWSFSPAARKPEEKKGD